MIEAELKARVRRPDELRAALARRAVGAAQPAVYRDTYYDLPGHPLTTAGSELRLRVIEGDGEPKTLLTYKRPAVDDASGSKPEFETTVADPQVVDMALRALGAAPFVAFEKHCLNFRLHVRGRDLLATVVTVPELDGTFVELETMTTEDDLIPALDVVRAVLAELGVEESALTSDAYTDAVLRDRHGEAWPAAPGSP